MWTPWNAFLRNWSLAMILDMQWFMVQACLLFGHVLFASDRVGFSWTRVGIMAHMLVSSCFNVFVPSAWFWYVEHVVSEGAITDALR